MSSPLHTGVDVLNVLQNMALSARAMAGKMPSRIAPTPRVAELPRNVAGLPLPQPLTPRLVSLGLDKPSADLISLAFSRASSKIKDTINDDLRRRRPLIEGQLRHIVDPKFCSNLTRAYIGMYTQSIRRWTFYILDVLVPRVLQARAIHEQRRASISPQRRKAFNQSAVPFLEEFFDTNAFPSRLEKHELAHKCDMEYRQIHVWFQNRRSRSRKDGKALKKPTSGALPKELEDCVVNAILPHDHHNDDIAEEGDGDAPFYDDAATKQCDAINPIAPPHAFPSPYPPLCSYNPFPLAPGQQAFETSWPRPATCERPRPLPVEMSELTSAMAKLSITDQPDVSCTSVSRSRASLRDFSPLLSYGTITICPRAPHPAFVRRRCPPTSTRRQRSASACSTLHAQAYSDYPTTPQKLSPDADAARPLRTPACPYPRKRRGLPRRLPQHRPRSNTQQLDATLSTPTPTLSTPTPTLSTPTPTLSIPTPTPTLSTLRMTSIASSATSLSSNNSESGADTPLSTPPIHLASLPSEEPTSSPTDAQAAKTLDTTEDTWSWLETLVWDGDISGLHWEQPGGAHPTLVFASH